MALLILVNELRSLRPEIDFTRKYLPDECPVLSVLNRFRQRDGHYLRGIARIHLLELFQYEMKMPELVIEEALPDRFDPGIGFVPKAAVVVVDFRHFVQEPFFERGFIRIDQ